jgi:V-type H+-transporting ATPase subunit a
VGNAHSGESHQHSFGELMVDQMIETIEYVLGSVSNTASYLRLWALSLAHGQLAKVFYSMILSNAITEATSVLSSTIMILIGFVIFFAVTFAVLLIMDTMECFLHGLRLHWVEFQNKFFKGDGLAFENFKHDIEDNN